MTRKIRRLRASDGTRRDEETLDLIGWTCDKSVWRSRQKKPGSVIHELQESKHG
jgi:hypothetical protein